MNILATCPAVRWCLGSGGGGVYLLTSLPSWDSLGHRPAYVQGNCGFFCPYPRLDLPGEPSDHQPAPVLCFQLSFQPSAFPVTGKLRSLSAALPAVHSCPECPSGH